MFLASSSVESFFQLIFILIVFVGILFVTYYVTRWIAGYQKAQNVNNNLEIIETIKLTNGKYVQLIRAGIDTFFVIAIGKDEITMLGELSLDQLKELKTADEVLPFSNQIDFKSILEKVSKKK
ncbi:MAG: flagellar biosynthetic protein FliO [Pseudobutyrivibrio sp.]|nr:flagellar biosynthetic protein FliO [Pseudobutyrivibrio sp.]